MEKKVYTPDELAQIFQISKHTVYELIKRGELQAFKIGNKMRVEQHEVDRFKENQKTSTTRQTPSTATVDHPIAALRLAGSHDLLLEELIKQALQDQLLIQPTYIGSLEGLMMLYRGQCDIAAIHLLDPNSQQYNLPFIHQLFVHEKITVLRFATREQGLIVAKGNPKGMNGMQDLKRQDIHFVNRQKGSGTRFLFDSLLVQNQISPANVNGYEKEEWNHLSTASHISRGAADVTFGIKSAAQHLGLDFIPVTMEKFDFVLKWTEENHNSLTSFLSLLQNPNVKAKLGTFEGYDLTRLGETIF